MKRITSGMKQIQLLNNIEGYDPDHIYYNVIIPHDPSFGDAASPMKYQENRVDALIDNPSDWYLSIIRFTIPGTFIPILVMPINSGSSQTDPNQTQFYVTLSYGGDDYTQNVVYVPDNVFPVPVPPSQNPPYYSQVITPYYYVYSYHHFLTMINTALETAFTALKTAHATAPITAAPYYIYDETTQLFSLIVEYSAFVSPGTVSLYVNRYLQKYFNGLHVKNIAVNAPSQKEILYIFEDYGNNYYTSNKLFYNTGTASKTGTTITGIGTTFTAAMVGGTIVWTSGESATIATFTSTTSLSAPASQSQNVGSGTYTIYYPNPTTFMRFTQEYIAIQYWNSFRDIVFLSGSIPIQAEYVPAQRTQSLQITIGENNFRPILTDFEPILAAAGDARSVLQYYPSGPYRLVNLQSNIPLRKLDVDVYWQDQLNNLYPMYVQPGQEATIKFLFVKRDVYRSTIKE